MDKLDLRIKTMLKNKIQQSKSCQNAIGDKFLFLDDIRHPTEAFEYTQQTMFLQKNGRS